MFEQWCKAYYRTETKCEMALNNLCECFNKYILEPKGLPILSCLEAVRGGSPAATRTGAARRKGTAGENMAFMPTPRAPPNDSPARNTRSKSHSTRSKVRVQK
ncbi:hypothetical protein LINPERHAP2_LOCUS14642 [Linum perenne]